MIDELAVGAAVICATAIIHVLGLAAVTAVMRRAIGRLDLLRNAFLTGLATIATVLGLFSIHAIEIWLWALVYRAVGAMPDVSTALYYSLTTFTTLGYGDVVAPVEWRLLGGLEGITGFLLIGWSTAYLVAAYVRHERKQQD